jgi:molecular chaperone GrpE
MKKREDIIEELKENNKHFNILFEAHREEDRNIEENINKMTQEELRDKKQKKLLLKDEMEEYIIEEKKKEKSEVIKNQYIEDKKELSKDELIEKLKHDRLVAYATLENTKKQLTIDKENAIKFANEKIVRDLLLPMETVENALNFQVDLEGKDKMYIIEQYKNMNIGLEFIVKKFNDSFEKNNIKKIDTKGEFNPHIHEAIGTDSNLNIENNHILETTQSGYIYNNRVIRSAKVIVNQIEKEDNE